MPVCMPWSRTWPLTNSNAAVEVKAVSSHGLTLSSLGAGEVLPGRGEGMPALQGPAWYADVLLDV